jgi:glycosyltransferase involved in cell wall biosynthesis
MAEILSVVWYQVHPDRFGGQKGIAQFNRHLAKHHGLTCLCSADNDPTDAGYSLRPGLPTGRWQFLAPANTLRIWRACRAVSATHLLVEHPQYGPPAALVSRWLGIPLVVHAHNIEAEVLRTTGGRGWRLAALWEGLALRLADLVFFKTEEDRDLAVRRYRVDPGRTHIVPFGLLRAMAPGAAERSAARRALAARHGLGAGERLLYFGGTLDYGPNAEVLRWMIAELLPEIRRRTVEPFRLLVTGRLRKEAFRWLEGLSDPSCLFAGDVSDTEELMLGADLLVNPVRSGGGIKVKNMEALGAGLGVVTTGHGARGIDRAAAGGKLVVVEADDVSAFADAVIGHWSDGAPTPAPFYDRYHWPNIVAAAAGRISAC